jgi:hypothetical protein
MTEEGAAAAAANLNRELTRHIVQAGRRLEFDVVTEYPIPGARLDVVWCWRPPTPLPHFDGAVPVVGFEIESSWRTRKHVKGDFLNLQDSGVALGVIVLASSSEKDEGLRTFACTLVDRPGARVLIWTDDDVRALSEGKPAPSLPVEVFEPAGADEAVDLEPSTLPVTPPSSVQHHAGKYWPLWEWLLRQEHRPITVTFSDIEQVLGFALPDSCRSHVAHWHSYDGSAVARAIIDAGWRARQVQLNSGTVTFVPTVSQREHGDEQRGPW